MNRRDDAERDPVLDDFEAWLRKTRPLHDGDLAAGVMRAIRAERLDGRTFRRQPWSPRNLRSWTRILAPAAAALAVILFLFARAGGPWSGTVSHNRTPHDAARATSTDAGSDRVRYVFQFSDDVAHEVCLVGSFNQWAVCHTRLEEAADGSWSVTLELPRGRYEYMFVVDGQWVTDPAAPRHIDDGFGRKNALLLL